MAAFCTEILRVCSSEEAKYRYLRLLTVIILGGLVYSNTFCVPFSFDDTANLQSNPVIQNFNFAGFKAALQSRRAFGIFTFQLNYFLGGWNLFWFHFTNLLIHLAAALTLYAVLTLLGKTPYAIRTPLGDAHIPLAFFAALIFVVHPVQTQAVTYIVQRFASLATLLYLAAAGCYLKMRLAQEENRRLVSVNSLLWLLMLLLLSLLAFYTKETAYTLPAALLLLELMFFRLSVSKIRTMAAWMSAFIVMAVVGLRVSGRSLGAVFSALDEATRVQTITARSDYLFTQFRVIMTYIRLLFLPINQSLDYDYRLAHSFFEWRVLLSFLVILLLHAAAVWMLWRSRNGQPLLRLASFGIFWFFLTLTVESSILPIIDLVFEHRLYLPSAGAVIAISAGILLFWSNDSLRKQRVCLAVMGIVLVFGLTAWHRNSVWRSETSLWADAVSKSPNSARAWNNLGGAYIKEKESLQALKALTRSIELDPSKADAWNNVGIAIDMLGVYSDRFHRTAEMFSDPASFESRVVSRWLGDVHNNLGLAYEILGNRPKAIENYRSAVGYNPALSLAYYNLGIISAAMGDGARYAEQRQILMMIDPPLADRLQIRTGKGNK